MHKLLLSTALTLVLTAPAWADQANPSAATAGDAAVLGSDHIVIAQDTDTDTDTLELEEDDTQGVTESQPGVTTEESAEGETAPAGTTGGPESKTSGDTAEGDESGGTSGSSDE